MTVEQRLEALERSVRRWRRFSVCLTLLVGACLIAAAPVDTKIEGTFLSLLSPAKSLQLVGASADDDGGKLFVFTDTGYKAGVNISHDANTAPRISLTNAKGQRAIELTAGPKGEGVIMVRDENGQARQLKP